MRIIQNSNYVISNDDTQPFFIYFCGTTHNIEECYMVARTKGEFSIGRGKPKHYTRLIVAFYRDRRNYRRVASL